MGVIRTSQVFPEMEGKFKVCDVPKQETIRGTVFWRFRFDTELGGETAIYEELIPIWLCAPMFRVLGFKEIAPGDFDDAGATEALGKSVKGKIKHETIKNGNKAGTVVARMKDMVPLAFDNPDIQKAHEEDSIPF